MAKAQQTAAKKTDRSKQPEVSGKILGPVQTLEEHVEPDWWRRIFNSLYLKTDADVVDDIRITQNEIDAFSKILDLKPEDDILDLCCGQGRHTLELNRRGFSAQGLDRSHYLIQRARTISKKEGFPKKFREGDARKLPFPPDSFDVIMMMGNSFGYFETIKDDLVVLKEVFRALKPWGRLLLDVTDGEFLKENFQARSWEWINKKLFVCRERSLSENKQRLISREVVTDVTKGVIADQFYAERLYSRDDIQSLLDQAGFSNVMLHGEVLTDSQRNQDLGMMARRIVVTGQVRKEWTRKKRTAGKKDKKKSVVVIFGDTQKPDPLKPSSVFDDDDFYTIDQLKSALNSISGYEFTYLSNHDTLIRDLSKLSRKVRFAINLCDEGFNNDPRKELHVPALLDMLEIPYSGAASQCLAFCYDKSLVRGIAKEMKIPVPKAFFIEPDDTTFNLPFSFPIIVKPNFGDSSFGITQESVAYNKEQLINAISMIREKLGYDKPILVEEFLTGKDLSVGIIGNPMTSYNILPLTEEDYSKVPGHLPRVCGYEAKWLPDSPYYKIKTVPVNLPEKTEKFITECCMKLFERLEVRDYGRFDWRLDTDGNPRLLEVNPNPGWCWDGHLAKMAAFADMSYADMIRAIIQSVELRIDNGIDLAHKNGNNKERNAA